MSNFVIGAGHTASGNIGCGVVEDLDESRCTREISQLVGKELEVRGHKANLIIIDKSNSYNCEDCFVRAQMANTLVQKEEVDLYVEIHINAGGGTGCEVLVTGHSTAANQYAGKICSSLSGALHIPNRGVKTQSLIADSSDSSKYNAEVIAKSITDGLVEAGSNVGNGFNNSDNGGQASSSSWKLGYNRNNIGWWYCKDNINNYYYTSQNGRKCIDGEWCLD